MSDENFWETNSKEWIHILNEQKIASRPITNKALIEDILRLHPSSLLDMGCGEGWLADALPKTIKYLGVDGSQALVQAAQRRGGRGIFSVASYEDIVKKSWTLEEKTDVVVFNFSLFGKDITSLLGSSSDFLNPRGHVIIQTLHPFFADQEYADKWNEDDFSKVSGSIQGKMPWYQRTLSSWCDAFSETQFVVEKISEPIFERKPASLIFTLGKVQN